MCGQYVLGARGGWDTHGLPVEIEVEKELGFSGKPDIERYGIAEFNKACKESVWRYVQDWERITSRIAYWLDLDHSYITYDNEYIESLWWILKSFSDQGLLFRDYKVTMHCPRCGTSLSDHEVSQGFQDDVQDPSVWVRFRHRPSGHSLDEQLAGASFVAWTTTPWTLPANAALAVNPIANYVLVNYQNNDISEKLVLAEALALDVLGENNYTILTTVLGESLSGVRYEPLFNYMSDQEVPADVERTYLIVSDNFVSLGDGSGVVHIAPAYGDLEIGRKYGLPTLFSVDLSGHVLPMSDQLGFAGLFFKDADPVIITNLKERGLLFRSGHIRHSYPFCWRCKTPLLYYAKISWYIRTTARKERLLATNQQINWVPDHIRNGRFGNWLENNIDWALSRERYWGTPLPIWICDNCDHIEVIGSVKELSDFAGKDLRDLELHRPYIDEVSWTCRACSKGTARRIPDVADCWFDSGAMPLAQWHYPFENQELFETASQADFISEAVDQTRGWFYTLHAVSTLLLDQPAFKNVICLGHILDARGEKMSKSRGNVVEPWQLLETYGADATRWFMYASAPPYNPRRFSSEQIGEVLRQFMLPLWNVYSFFVTYANVDRWDPSHQSFDNLKEIDRWALADLNRLVSDVTKDLTNYDVYQPAKRLEKFVERLSNWYVRRNRRRFWKSGNDADKNAAYTTLYSCLVTLVRVLAPFMPFLSEAMYRSLIADQDINAPQSVHLASWPEVKEGLIDETLIAAMETLLSAVAAGRAARKSSGIKIRQPLQKVVVSAPTTTQTSALRQFRDELQDELNVKQIEYLETTGLVEYRFKPNLLLVGKKYGKLVPSLKATLQQLTGSEAAQVRQRVEKGQNVSLIVDGQTIDLLPEELIAEVWSPQGYAVAEKDGVVVALDTLLTPELQLEGFARDLVHSIQSTRKDAGLEITDRIRLFLHENDSGLGDVKLDQLINQHSDYIKGETLAEELILSMPPEEAQVASIKLGKSVITIGVLRHKPIERI